MECIVCGTESGKGKTCSPKCRKILSRSVTTSVTKPKCDKGVTEFTTTSVTPIYEIIPDVKVYGRQAVKYDLNERWDLRPEPLDRLDTPKPLNRGKYIRTDGSEYQFDASGRAFDCTYVPKRDAHEVYPTMASLKEVKARADSRRVHPMDNTSPVSKG